MFSTYSVKLPLSESLVINNSVVGSMRCCTKSQGDGQKEGRGQTTDKGQGGDPRAPPSGSR